MTSNVALSDAMATTSKTMGDMNKIMNPQAIGKNLRDFQAANMKMEMTDEMSEERKTFLITTDLISCSSSFLPFQSTTQWTTFWPIRTTSRRATRS